MSRSKDLFMKDTSIHLDGNKEVATIDTMMPFTPTNNCRLRYFGFEDNYRQFTTFPPRPV